MFNQFTGVGNLTADPELRHTQSGKAVATFTVCCDHGYGDNKKTEFVRCVTWDTLAELCNKYLEKGSKAMIQGPMQTKKWQDKNGNDRFSTEIIAREVRFLNGKPKLTPKDEHGIPESLGQDVPF